MFPIKKLQTSIDAPEQPTPNSIPESIEDHNVPNLNRYFISSESGLGALNDLSKPPTATRLY